MVLAQPILLTPRLAMKVTRDFAGAHAASVAHALERVDLGDGTST